MGIDTLLEGLDAALSQERPFLVYSIPNSDRIEACFDIEPVAEPTRQHAGTFFVASPFAGPVPHTYRLNKLEQYPLPVAPHSGRNKRKAVNNDREAYISKIKHAIETLRQGALKKVVLSRRAEVELRSFSASELCQNLFSQFAETFRYLWYDPEYGLWCGATPEVLVDLQKGRVSAMSLAGTRLKDELSANPWTEKETEEQGYVTNMIADTMAKYTGEVNTSARTTRQTGDLVHLLTVLQGTLKESAKLNELVAALHPTPAVCGVPTRMAYEYINKFEGYDREYYTGYLGLHHTRESNATLFVNLRCMKISDGRALLYAGGGITANSVPEDEWQETENKLGTMLKVLAPFL